MYLRQCICADKIRRILYFVHLLVDYSVGSTEVTNCCRELIRLHSVGGYKKQINSCKELLWFAVCRTCRSNKLDFFQIAATAAVCRGSISNKLNSCGELPLLQSVADAEVNKFNCCRDMTRMRSVGDAKWSSTQ